MSGSGAGDSEGRGVESGRTDLVPEAWTWHLLGLVLPLLVIGTNLAGGLWVWAGITYVLGLGPVLDVLFGKARRPRPPRASGRPFMALLYVHAALQFAQVGVLLWRASLGEVTGDVRVTLGATLSAGVASGVSGLFMETHPNPDEALSDGPNAWPLLAMRDLLATLVEIDRLVKARGFPKDAL